MIVIKRWIKRASKRIPVWIKSPTLMAIRGMGNIPLPILFYQVLCCYGQCRGLSDAVRQKQDEQKKKAIYHYLEKKYGEYFKSNKQCYDCGEYIEKFPIWIFWWQGEAAAPDIVKRCIHSVRKHANWHPVHVITKDNYSEYVKIAGYILNKVNTKKISLTHFSDILRMNLIAEHGGLWLDATIFCSKEIAGDIFKKPIFTGRNPEGDVLNISRWEWTGYAIYGWKGNALFCLARDLFDAYWREHTALIDYYLIDYVIRLIEKNDEIVSKLIESVPINNVDIYYFQKHFNDPYCSDGCLRISDSETWLYKLTWKTEYLMETPAKQRTVYAWWCSENGLEIV